MDKIISFFLGWALVVIFQTLARADVALIQVSPCAILQTYPGTTAPFINVPGKWQTSNAVPGWVSGDGAYKLVPVVSATIILPGQLGVTPIYVTDGLCNVTVTYSTIPGPATCSGIPTVLFSTANGVVTHC
jgi:hypothetical protein